MGNYPEPKTGGPKKPSGPYPEPTGPSNYNFGMDNTTHNGNYPQPDGASVDAPPGIVPGPAAYQVDLSGNAPGPVTTGTPGVNKSGNAGDGAAN